MRRTVMVRTLILVVILAFVSCITVFADDPFMDEWTKFVKKAHTYMSGSFDYWKMPQFNDYKLLGEKLLPNLEKIYKNSNDWLEGQMVLHLVGEITQDMEYVWKLFYDNQNIQQELVKDFIIEYLRNYRNSEFLTFCGRQLIDGTPSSAESALRVFAWQGDRSRVQEIITYFERTKNIEALHALGEIGDTSAIPLLRKYVNSPDLDESNAALIALGLMGDKETVEIVFYRMYQGQDENYHDSYSRSVLEGVQSREVIDWLIEDAVENIESISVLARISDRAHLTGIKNPTIADLIVYFSDNPDRWEAELTEIKAWWNMERPNWFEPKKRIYVQSKTPVLGSIPEDLIWLDPMEGFCP